MKSVFVTGTDTNIGKTLITGLLADYLQQHISSVVTQKWIQCGSSGFQSDIQEHFHLMGKSKKDFQDYLSLILPYSFSYPASPHLAAQLAKKKINVQKIISAYTTLQKIFDCVVVEGVGGVMVPVNAKKKIIDITAQLKIPTLVVVNNKLGCINHTLLTIEALKHRKIPIIGILYNSLREPVPLKIRKNNPRIIS